MKALTKEEMKEIGGARTGGECSAGYSCMGGGCWHEIVHPSGSIWVTSGETC
ncbi:MAG TPA: hypothetical protein VK186_12025 [Candidatus Deferrimicrobium sp.]|nr:hypothetical protein [Candidatus Kapabacteria bacterium]HLP59555.1 hypothetical protein [Candidatus Deferrimicrobium sp.]